MFFERLIHTYSFPLRLAGVLFIVGFLYLLAASPHAPIHIMLHHHFFVLTVFFVLGILLYYLRKNPSRDPLTALAITLSPLSILFMTAVHLLDAVVLFIPFFIGFSGFFFMAILLVRHLLSYVTKEPPQTGLSPMSKTLPLPRFIAHIIAGTFILLFLFLGLYHIGQQTLVDEPLWVFGRVERYWDNIIKGDLPHTRPSDKPGVTVAFLSGYALRSYPQPHTIKETITPEQRENLLAKMRVPLVLFVALLLPLFYHLTTILFGRFFALTALACVTLSPLLLGMTRMINPDALLWLLLPLTLLSFFATLTTQRKAYIVTTGILFGLALLTKYVANILFVFLPLSMFFYHLFSPSSRSITSLRTSLQAQMRFYGIIVLIALIVYVFLLPSTWVHPQHILLGTLWSQAFSPLWKPFLIVMFVMIIDLFIMPRSLLASAIAWLSRYQKVIAYTIAHGTLALILFTIITAHLGHPFDYQLALRSPKSALTNVGPLATFFADYYVLIFGIHSTILIATLYGLYQLPRHNTSTTNHRFLLIFLLFIPFYYVGALFGDVAATMRYQIALYPLIFFIGSYGLYTFVRHLPHKARLAFVFFLLGSLLWSMLTTKPFYQSYANIFLPLHHILNVKDMGDGSYQAAQWLNHRPHAQDLWIWADKSGVCASFIGHCTTTVDVTRIAREHMTFDFYVTSSGRQHLVTRTAQRKRRKKTAPQKAQHFELLYTHPFSPVHTILLGHNPTNTIKIFSAKNTSITP